MKQLEIYEVRKWDGGNGHRFAFYLSDKTEADKYKAKNTYDDVRATIIVIYDTLEEVEENETKKVRQRVWDKLSPLERQALGMTSRPE